MTLKTSGSDEPDTSRFVRYRWLTGMVLALLAGQVLAELTIEPITWDVVGLDHNRPLTEGPELFPVGAEVCSDVGTTNVEVDMVWEDPNDDDWVFNRPGSQTSLTFDSIAAGECIDAYFEVQVTRDPAAFGQFRPYQIIASDGTSSATTPDSRAIYIQELVSQNRNSTELIRWGQQSDGSDWQVLGGGGGLNLQVGESYFIELTTATATDYEELQSFLTLSNTIFQVKSVSTTYTTLSAPASRVPQPNPRLWADGCLWDSDIDSPNWRSCLSDGKAGGTVVTVYEIDIISGGGNSIGLEALIYDRSGGSFHYNTDFSQSPGDLVVFEPAAPGFDKRFIPDTIGANGTATLRLTISNPNPVAVSGYAFTDDLPFGMEVAGVPNLSNSCGGTATATAGGSAVSLDGGALEANSSCSLLVDVTVPDVGASYPLTLSNNVDLLVGDPADPEFVVNAADDLEVTEFPPPPQECTPTAVAAWNSFDSASAPSPTADPDNRSAAAEGGLGLAFSIGTVTANGEWAAATNTANQNLTAAVTSDAYYEFSLDTVGLTTLDFGLEAFRQNGNAPGTLTLFWGADATSLNQSVTLSEVPTRSNSAGFRNFKASDLGNLDDGSNGGDGRTLFRVYAYAAANTNQAVSILDVLLSSGETCVDADPATAPAAPEVTKQFESPPGTAVTTAGLGQQLRLAFTINNPNTDDALTGLKLVDALPSGLQAVPGTFVNNCIGGTWAETSPGVLALEESSLDADASCTLSVDVETTSVGELTNLSDPVDASETLPGNSARASLTVEAPPETPSMVKFFDPNPLFDPAGTARLVFRISNNDDAVAIDQVAFTDTMPSGLILADPLSATTSNCGTPLVSASSPGVLEFSGGSVPPNTDSTVTTDNVCEVSVDVELTDPGAVLPVWFDNATSPISHVFNGSVFEGNQATATLLVDDPIPGIALSKQVGIGTDPDGAWSDYLAVELGGQVYYKLTVENIGETELSAIDVDDPDLDPDIDTDCSWPASLPVADAGDPVAHIAECIVGPVDIDTSGVFPNTATASGAWETTTVADTDSATFATAVLSHEKTADRSTFDGEGEVIGYSFTVENTGAAILSSPVAITDDLVPDALCPEVSTTGDGDNFLDPGEVLECSGSYTTTSADVTTGQVVNNAFASVPEVDSNVDTETVELAQPALGVAKTLTGAPDPIEVGSELSYTVTAINSGNVTLNNVVVSDDLVNATGGTTPCATLAVGESCTLEGTYTVTQADVDAGEVSNTGSGESDETARVEDTLVTAIDRAPDLGLSNLITAGDPYALSGDVINYELTATNSGNVTLTGVSISDPDTTIGSCTPTQPTALAPGETLVCAATYAVDQADLDAGSFTSTAEAAGADPDSQPVTASDSATANAETTPGLDVTKELTDAPDPIEVGSELSYTVTAINSGNVTLNNVVVSDDLVNATGGTTPCATLAVGESCTLEGSYTVTQADVDAGEVVNIGSAISDEITDPVETELVTPLAQTPALDVTKELTDAPDPIEVGSELSYTVTAINSGNIQLTDVIINDSLVSIDQSADCTWPGTVGELSVGAEVACVLAYTVTELDTEAGEVVNTGSASAPDPTDSGNPPIFDEHTVTTPVEDTKEAALDLVKEVTNAPDPIIAGSVVTYTITATNAGNTDLVNVVIDDDRITPDSITCELVVPGATCALIGDYTVTEDDVSTGEILNTAIANAEDDEGGTLPQVDDATVTAVGRGSEILPVPSLGRIGAVLMIALMLLAGGMILAGRVPGRIDNG